MTKKKENENNNLRLYPNFHDLWLLIHLPLPSRLIALHHLSTQLHLPR